MLRVQTLIHRADRLTPVGIGVCPHRSVRGSTGEGPAKPQPVVLSPAASELLKGLSHVETPLCYFLALGSVGVPDDDDDDDDNYSCITAYSEGSCALDPSCVTSLNSSL